MTDDTINDRYKVKDRPLEPPDRSAGECPKCDANAYTERGVVFCSRIDAPAVECDPWFCSDCNQPMPEGYVPNHEEQCEGCQCMRENDRSGSETTRTQALSGGNYEHLPKVWRGRSVA